jgi:hypothetical protein
LIGNARMMLARHYVEKETEYGIPKIELPKKGEI